VPTFDQRALLLKDQECTEFDGFPSLIGPSADICKGQIRAGMLPDVPIMSDDLTQLAAGDITQAGAVMTNLRATRSNAHLC
jgi:hypothetical protein